MKHDRSIELCTVNNAKGPTLCYAAASGVKIIKQDGLAFKDLAKDGILHPYEDWRLKPEQRAADLAKRLSVAEIAGLMLYSKHQFVPGNSNPYFGTVTYGGQPFNEAGVPPHTPSDQQIDYLTNDYLRHLLVAAVDSTQTAAEWSNRLQALAEAQPWGIPINMCSDPRHGTDASTEFNVGAGSGTSQWPENIGLAATFDPDLVEQFGRIASREYRALGLATSLSPQCDLTTDPRWFRYAGSFGEGADLAAAMTGAYCDGFQTSAGGQEIAAGWGYESVNTMVKHWPGGACGEGGRDAHFGCGKYSVYPGDNFAYHLKPFTDGAFTLKGQTRQAAAVMPYYTVPFGQDRINGENVGCGYNAYLIKDLLRGTYGYDGVVCTDWAIVFDQNGMDSIFSGKCWGVEHLTVAERCLKVLMAGTDQFGGLSEAAPVLAAYQLGADRYGEAAMRERFCQSARRILTNIFQVGLFENPYLDPAVSAQTVGQAAYMSAGYAALVKSLVMLKNVDRALPLKAGCRIYVPRQYTAPSVDWTGNPVAEKWEAPAGYEVIKQYFEVTDDPTAADAAVCVIRMPGYTVMAKGYSTADRDGGGTGYVPVSLQYRPYTADDARPVSLAGGDPTEAFTDRSYRGKTVTTDNEKDLEMVLATRAAMPDKPVIVVANLSGPMVMNEFEGAADSIIVNFNKTLRPVMEILSGRCEPSGLLPLQIPADMKTVEMQAEDVPFDMECHVDAQGHVYDYTFGMNWQGVIDDERVRRYARPGNNG